MNELIYNYTKNELSKCFCLVAGFKTGVIEVFGFASKPEQPGLFSSIRFKFRIEQP